MKSHLLVSEFLSTPWALMPERLTALSGVIRRWDASLSASPERLAEIERDISAREIKRQNAVRSGGSGVAVLPLYGVLTQRGNMATEVSGSGAISTQQFSAMLQEALADESVGQILIDIDSPGGSVYGIGELASEIIAARAQKPVVAIANSLAASAAYWIGASCSELYVTPGGEVGSIGVYQAHQDYSAALESEGVKTTLIQAGKYKTEGNPYTALDADAQAYMQSRVDDYYAAFTKAIAKGRGVGIEQVRSGMGEGRVLGAEAALAQNMVDGVATFGEVLKKMQRSARQPAASRLAAAKRELDIQG